MYEPEPVGSLWPDPIVSPQELLETIIQLLKARVGNGETLDAVEEMERLLAKFRLLGIGGRSV